MKYVISTFKTATGVPAGVAAGVGTVVASGKTYGVVESDLTNVLISVISTIKLFMMSQDGSENF